MEPENDIAVASRTERLLHLISEIRNDPRRDLASILKQFNISRSQFYKDRTALAQIGFAFEYKKGLGFRILEDRLSPVLGLSLSESLIVMFALKHLCVTGDGHLAATALSAARKLAGGLPEPFFSETQRAFDRVVWCNGYGCSPETVKILEKAVADGRRLKIFYESPASGKNGWREIDPKRLYFVGRALYLHGKSHGDTHDYKVFRVSRIKKVRETGISLSADTVSDGFYENLGNAFSAFIGPNPQEVTLRFSGEAAQYAKEVLWHPSQRIEEKGDGVIHFTVSVAEPREVLWWSFQYGSNSEVLSPTWLRDEAKKAVSEMAGMYKHSSNE